MSGTSPKISVIIPVRNEAKKIRACIQGILNQSIPPSEIIVIDSGSTDGTLEILKEYSQVRVIEIPGKEFNHGDTRNLGVRESGGDYCLFTVGDAIACDNYWIENLYKGFVADDVAAVCGLQAVPHDADKNPMEWFRPATAVPNMRFVKLEPGAFEKLSAKEKKDACGWDDVSALYKKSALLSIPFRRITYGEDALWAKDALMAGFTLVYNPAARVYHYHLENYDFTLKRTLTTLYFRYRHFGFLQERPSYNLRTKLSTLKTLFWRTRLSFSERLRWWKYNIEIRRAQAKAYDILVNALTKGEEELDKVHTTICGAPPIPVK